MLDTDPQQPPAIIELRDDARAIARLRLYGDDCVLMGWTGDYKSPAPIMVYLAKADARTVALTEAVTILLAETENEIGQLAVRVRRKGLGKTRSVSFSNLPSLSRTLSGNTCLER